MSETLAEHARSIDAWQIGGVLPSGIAFEVPEAGVAVVEPAEPAAVEPVEPTESAAAAPAPSWDDPALTDLVDQRAAQLIEQQFAQLAPLLQQALGGQQQQQGQPQGQPQLVDEFGQLDPNALLQILAQQQQQNLQALDQRIAQIQAPLAARAEQETVAEGEQRIKDMIADDVSRNGDLPAKAQAAIRPLADTLFPEIAARYGNTPRAAELAVQRAAGMVRDMIAEASGNALTVEQNRIAALSGARREPGVAGAGVEGLSDKPLSTRELAAKYGARATALAGTPTGT